MKYLLFFFTINFFFIGYAQEDYSAIIQKAENEMNTDSSHYEKALNLYEKAFELFPNEIQQSDQYWASVLAASLKLNDKAFMYLIPLAELDKDDYGDPGWYYIIGGYSEEDYKNLFNDPRWEKLKEKAEIDKRFFFKALKKDEKEFYSHKTIDLQDEDDNQKLYYQIKNYNPYLEKSKQDYSISFKINDTLCTSFLIHLPKNYTPQKKYPLLFFLHGGVRYAKFLQFQTAESRLGGWERFYTKYADQNEVILVFPSANKKYNWMTSDDGFPMILDILKLIKTSINVDDNSVFISGHSNGATGSFSYLMKNPTPFAGFYGFNTHPKVYTGGTFIENIENRSFFNISTDQDYYYPPSANDKLTNIMKSINADYQDYRFNGFPHWFPEFDESEQAFQILFKDLMARKRVPFPKKIIWHFDDNKYGHIDWLENIKLDTLEKKKDWQKEINFKINKWLKYDENDSLILKDVDLWAFDFPRKSGKIKASFENNVFNIETSCIESFKILISPEMVNLKRKIKVYVNGKLYFNKKISFNHDFLLNRFNNTLDREQIWVNYIDLNI